MPVIGDAILRARVDTTQAQTSINKFGSTAKLAIAGVGVAAVAKFGAASFKAFTESERSENRLNDAFARFPKLADSSAGAIDKLAAALQKKTKFDDESIRTGAAQIAQFGLTGKQVETLLPTILDFAAKTGRDVPESAQLIGKALLGKTKSLQAVGIQYKSTGDRAKDFTNITSLLRGAVGGFAAKEGKTTEGQLAILKNQFGELQESVGAAVAKGLTPLLGTLLKVVTVLQPFAPVLVPIVAGVIALVAALKIWTIVQTALNVVLTANPIALVVLAIAALVVAVLFAIKHFDAIKAAAGVAFGFIQTVVGAVVNFVRANWPLMLAILTGPIGVAVLLIVRHFTQIRDFITNAISAVLGFLRRNWPLILAILTGPIGLIVLLVVRNFSRIRDFIGGVLNAIVGFFRALPGRILGVFSGLVNSLFNIGRDIVNGLIRGVKSLAGAVINALLSLIPGPLRKFAGALGLGSPSRVFEGFGRDIVFGLVRGIDRNAGRVPTAVARLSDRLAVDGLSGLAPALAGSRAGLGAVGGPQLPAARATRGDVIFQEGAVQVTGLGGDVDANAHAVLMRVAQGLNR